MDNDIQSPGAGDKKKIILIVGAAAVVLAVILLIALMPKKPKVNPYVKQLEQEVTMYTGQIDSLNDVVDGLNSRIDRVRVRMDSVQTSNRSLLSSLQRVTREMSEYRNLYRRQQAVNKQLVTELAQVKTEKTQAITQVKQLKTQVDSLNGELYEKTVRLVRLESNLEQAIQQKKSMQKTVTSVLVYTGTEEDLKQAGYLKTWRPAIFSKDYRVIGFPNVMDAQNKNAVMRVPLGETLALPGHLEAIADRHGKLDKGKEYEVSNGPSGQTLVTFIDSTLQGERVLAVMKNK